MNFDRQHAHQLLDQLGADQLAAVLQLLEVMIDPGAQAGQEALTAEDRKAIAASREWFEQNPDGIPLDQVVAECGFTMDEIRAHRATEMGNR